MAVTSTTVTSTATLILSANTQRQSVIITNIGDETIYFGPDNAITSSNSPHIIKDGTFSEDNGGTRLWLGDIYAITSSGTADIRVWERIT